MGTTLYLECASGISGDMTVAALLDLGADEQRLRRALATLPVHDFDVHVTRTEKNGIAACDFDVVLDEAHANHDHDMAYLYGHLTDDGAAPAHGHVHEHDHGHERGHVHEHGHRTLAEILAIVDAADLTPRARSTAHRVFEVLAAGEAAAHGTSPDAVLLHEVGAIDSIVDVVSCAVCLDDLDVERVVASDLAEGTGTVRCAHGIVPIPVPAVANIAAAHRLTLRPTNVQGELVTPTGAAIVAALTDGGRPASFTPLRVGVGAGKRDHAGSAGVLRAFLIEEPRPTDLGEDEVTVLECDIDDSDGEALGALVPSLLEAGAREAHYVALVTKKNRPAWQLQVVCGEAERPSLERLIFEQTSTIGIRRTRMERTVLPRRACELQTPYGTIAAKRVTLPDGLVRTYPEHDDVLRAACEHGVPYPQAKRVAAAAATELDRQDQDTTLV